MAQIQRLMPTEVQSWTCHQQKLLTCSKEPVRQGGLGGIVTALELHFLDVAATVKGLIARFEGRRGVCLL
jgi:hypothetical protein